MKRLLRCLIAMMFLDTVSTLFAQVPGIINYQGRVSVAGTNFDGTGQFKFALVNTDGSATYWSNDGNSPPTAAVSLTVSKGLYSVLLGDATLSNMTVIPTAVFTNSDVRLRVWFDDGVSGSQQLSPDQRIAAVGYALMAGTASDWTGSNSLAAAAAAYAFAQAQSANATNAAALGNLDSPGWSNFVATTATGAAAAVSGNLLATGTAANVLNVGITNGLQIGQIAYYNGTGFVAVPKLTWNGTFLQYDGTTNHGQVLFSLFNDDTKMCVPFRVNATSAVSAIFYTYGFNESSIAISANPIGTAYDVSIPPMNMYFGIGNYTNKLGFICLDDGAGAAYTIRLGNDRNGDEAAWNRIESGPLTVHDWTIAGNIINWVLTYGGENYSSNDVVTAEGGNHDAYFLVTSVDGSGMILTLSMTSSGSGYATDTDYNLSGGNGANATITVQIADELVRDALIVNGNISASGSLTASNATYGTFNITNGIAYGDGSGLSNVQASTAGYAANAGSATYAGSSGYATNSGAFGNGTPATWSNFVTQIRLDLAGGTNCGINVTNAAGVIPWANLPPGILTNGYPGATFSARDGWRASLYLYAPTNGLGGIAYIRTNWVNGLQMMAPIGWDTAMLVHSQQWFVIAAAATNDVEVRDLMSYCVWPPSQYGAITYGNTIDPSASHTFIYTQTNAPTIWVWGQPDFGGIHIAGAISNWTDLVVGDFVVVNDPGRTNAQQDIALGTVAGGTNTYWIRMNSRGVTLSNVNFTGTMPTISNVVNVTYANTAITSSNLASGATASNFSINGLNLVVNNSAFLSSNFTWQAGNLTNPVVILDTSTGSATGTLQSSFASKLPAGQAVLFILTNQTAAGTKTFTIVPSYAGSRFRTGSGDTNQIVLSYGGQWAWIQVTTNAIRDFLYAGNSMPFPPVYIATNLAPFPATIRQSDGIALVSAANISIAVTSKFYSVILSNNAALSFVGGDPGVWFNLKVQQDGTGSWTNSWPSDVSWPNSTPPTQTTNAYRADLFEFFSDGSLWLGRYTTNYTTVSRAPLTASGFGDSNANGVYYYSGVMNGSHWYTGPYHLLFRLVDGDWAGNWVIASNLDDDPDDVYYFSGSADPTANAWISGPSGTTPAGTISGVWP